jgi:hypothetical protein
MKYHATPLVFVSFAIAFANQSAFAQDARFIFAPQLFEQERIRLPKRHHSSTTYVSPDILGLKMLESTSQQFEAPLSPMQTTEQLPGPSFNSSFGQPSERIPQLISATPEISIKAQSASTKSMPQQRQSTHKQLAVRGKVLNKSLEPTELAKPPAVYGDAIGYVPGQPLASTEHSGSKKVSGRLLSQIK